MAQSDKRVSSILTSLPKKFTVKEEDGKSEVDGVNILARVEGPAFFPGEVGGNGRRYPLETWMSKLDDPEFQHRVESRLMYGAIGHEVEINDDTLRQGLVSHIVSKIWYDEELETGMAEYLILGTESGKILNTLLRAGSKLSVSTLTSGIESELPDGTVEIQDRDFDFERIDFVIEPSYKKAVPILKESVQDKPKPMKTEGNKMDNEITAKLARAETTLAAYQELGTVKNLTESLTKLREYQELVETPTELSGVIDSATASLEASADEIEKLRETVADLTANQITQEEREKLDLLGETQAADVKALIEQAAIEGDTEGKVVELQETVEALTASLEETKNQLAEYLEVVDGATPQELTELFEAVEESVEEQVSNQIKDAAAELGVTENAIATLMEKGMSLEDAIGFLESVVPAKEEVTELAESETEGEEVELEGAVHLGESLNTKILRDLGRVSRQGESQSKKPAAVSRVTSLAESLVSNTIGSGARKNTRF